MIRAAVCSLVLIAGCTPPTPSGPPAGYVAQAEVDELRDQVERYRALAAEATKQQKELAAELEHHKGDRDTFQRASTLIDTLRAELAQAKAEATSAKSSDSITFLHREWKRAPFLRIGNPPDTEYFMRDEWPDIRFVRAYWPDSTPEKPLLKAEYTIRKINQSWDTHGVIISYPSPLGDDKVGFNVVDRGEFVGDGIAVALPASQYEASE